jgi:hypothetical protein
MSAKAVVPLARPVILALFLLPLALESAHSQTTDKKKPAATTKRPVAGTYQSNTGQLLRRTPAGKWLVVKKNDKLFAGDLLMAGVGASLENPKGTVKVSFLGNLHGNSPLPIIETAIVLNKNPDVDLDLTLDRGRVDVTNLKKSGSATVVVRVRDQKAELTLLEPGTRFAMEVYGRWPRGVPFEPELKPGGGPSTEIIFLVLAGSVDAKSGATTHHLKAPPGPALIELDLAHGFDPTPRQLDEIPEWARDGGEDTPEIKAHKAAAAKFRATLVKKGLPAALEESVESDDPASRRLAVFVMGATDDLERLGNVLNAAKHRDLWDHGVRALRHWIGRAPGQDQILYQRLQERRGYSPAHAATVLHLLHSFGEDQLAQPETYEILIEYLGHEKLAIRGLAHWHLVRLVPEGRKIDFDPLGDPASRKKAQEAWRKLIPPGSLPPPAKPTAEK